MSSRGDMKRFTIRIPNEVAAGAHLLSEIENKSVNQIVLECLVERINGAKNDPEAKKRAAEQIAWLREQYGV